MVTDRSADTRKAILEAVIRVLAAEGAARLTHRRVADAAGRALSGTSYHFDSKQDMLCGAARLLLENRAVTLSSNAPEPAVEVRARLEIFLAAAWDPALSQEMRLHCDQIFPGLSSLERARIDRDTGLQFIAAALGQSGPALLELIASSPEVREIRPLAGSGKAARSRAKMIEATISLMTKEGAGAVSYRAVAELTGAALSAPAYHFGSIEGLLAAARDELFRASRDRYRSGWVAYPRTPLSPAALADVTTAIFTREATEFALASAAHYSVWLEAPRADRLRDEIRLSVAALTRAWARRLEHFGASMSDGLALQAHFIGALLRIIACGSRTADLSSMRADILALIFEIAEN